MLNPVRVAFLQALVGPDELKSSLVVHCDGVIDGVGHPDGTVHVINSHTVCRGVAILALVVLLDGQLSKCLSLEGVSVQTCQGRSQVASRTHGGHKELVGLRRVANLVLAGQALNNVCHALRSVHGAVCLSDGGSSVVVARLGLGSGCRVALEFAGFGGDLLDLGVVARSCGDLELQDGVRLNFSGLCGYIVALAVLTGLAGDLVRGADGAGGAIEHVGYGCGCASLLVHSNNGAVGQHDQVVCLAAVHCNLGDQLVCCAAVNHANLAGAEVRNVYQVVCFIIVQGECLSADRDELLELVGGRIIDGHAGVHTVHALGGDVNFVLRVVNRNVRGAHLALSVALGVEAALHLEGLGVDDENLAASTLGHIQLAAIDQNIHADVAGAAVGRTLKLNLLNLLSLQVNSRDKVTAGHEGLTGLVVNQNGARVLNPVRISLCDTCSGPDLLHRCLIIHGQGVVSRVSDPDGAVYVINGDAVGCIVLVALVVLDDGQFSHCLNLQGVGVNTCNGRDLLVAVSSTRNPNLVGFLGVGDLELAGQTLGNLCHRLIRDGASVTALACCRGGVRSERCGDGGNTRDCQCKRANGEALEYLARCEVHVYVLSCGWCVNGVSLPHCGEELPARALGDCELTSFEAVCGPVTLLARCDEQCSHIIK